MFGTADFGSFVVAVVFLPMIFGPGNLTLIASTGKGDVAGGLPAFVAAHRLAERLRARRAVSLALNRLAGVFLIRFGVKLVLSR